jgi:hypothetical protein
MVDAIATEICFHDFMRLDVQNPELGLVADPRYSQVGRPYYYYYEYPFNAKNGP